MHRSPERDWIEELDDSSIRSAALQAAQEEKALWEEKFAEVRREGERRLQAAKTAGKQRCEQLLKEIEQRYISEFQSKIESAKSSQAGDEAECKRLEGEIAAVKRALEAERETISRRRREEELEERTKQAEAAKRRKMLGSLKSAVRDLWVARDVDTKHIVSFLHKVHDATPATPGVVRAYERKVQQLKDAMPLYQALTRKEVLEFRIANWSRELRDAGDRSSVTSQLRQAEYELRDIKEQLRNGVVAWEKQWGTPFRYK